jgi:hypothetical protein
VKHKHTGEGKGTSVGIDEKDINETGNEFVDCDIKTGIIKDNSDKEIEHHEDVGEEVKDSDDNVEDGEMYNISAQNKEYRPFRNEESRAHINSHMQAGRSRNSDSMCSTSTVSSIAPEVIRAKVKKQQKKQQQILKARRIRKSGEASLQTRQRRDTQLDIKQSTSDVWF